jgi:hypothetical protein
MPNPFSIVPEDFDKEHPAFAEPGAAIPPPEATEPEPKAAQEPDLDEQTRLAVEAQRASEEKAGAEADATHDPEPDAHKEQPDTRRVARLAVLGGREVDLSNPDDVQDALIRADELARQFQAAKDRAENDLRRKPVAAPVQAQPQPRVDAKILTQEQVDAAWDAAEAAGMGDDATAYHRAKAKARTMEREFQAQLAREQAQKVSLQHLHQIRAEGYLVDPDERAFIQRQRESERQRSEAGRILEAAGATDIDPARFAEVRANAIGYMRQVCEEQQRPMDHADWRRVDDWSIGECRKISGGGKPHSGNGGGASTGAEQPARATVRRPAPPPAAYSPTGSGSAQRGGGKPAPVSREAVIDSWFRA